MMKRLASLLLAMLLVMGCVGEAGAHNSAAEHWQDLKLVLFGDKAYRGKTKIVDNYRIVLERASSLCIDQFGSSSKSYLVQLQLKGVAELPKTIDEIDLIATANDHRGFTHLGWNHDYKEKEDKRNPEWGYRWELRQEVLRNSVELVFDFETVEKKESFCQLLYCIHILGDHIEFEYGTYNKGESQVLKLAGNHGQASFLSELMTSLDVVFEDQKHSYHYMLMLRELLAEEILISSLLNIPNDFSADIYYVEAVDSKTLEKSQLLELLNEPEKMNTAERFKSSYTVHAKRILDILSTHIPQLLKQEPFFNRVFP